MGSVTRRLQRHLAWKQPPKSAEVIALDDGFRLCARLERAAKEFGASDPMQFLEYLRRMRRGYHREFDGPSVMMDLIDEIAAFELKEATRVKDRLEARKLAQS